MRRKWSKWSVFNRICGLVALCRVWAWNKKAAIRTTVAECIGEARQSGRTGVRALAFRSGQWVVVHQWRADEPVGGV